MDFELWKQQLERGADATCDSSAPEIISFADHGQTDPADDIDAAANELYRDYLKRVSPTRLDDAHHALDELVNHLTALRRHSVGLGWPGVEKFCDDNIGCLSAMRTDLDGDPEGLLSYIRKLREQCSIFSQHSDGLGSREATQDFMAAAVDCVRFMQIMAQQ